MTEITKILVSSYCLHILCMHHVHTEFVVMIFLCVNLIMLVLSWVTHAGCIAAGVGLVFSCICLSVCPRSKRKTAWAINTKLCRRILYSSRSACIDPSVKRSEVKVTWYENRLSRMVVSDHDGYCVYLCCLWPLPALVCMSIWLPMFSC